jgi:hypothetical protein
MAKVKKWGKAQGETFPKWGPRINCCPVLRPHIVGKILPWGFTLHILSPFYVTLTGGIGRLKRPLNCHLRVLSKRGIVSINSTRAWDPHSPIAAFLKLGKAEKQAIKFAN